MPAACLLVRCAGLAHGFVNDRSVVAWFRRDDPDWLVADRRRGRRDVLPRHGMDRAEFERDLPIERPGKLGERTQRDFRLARQLAIDVLALTFEPACQLLLGQAGEFLFRDGLEQLAANPPDQSAGCTGPRVDVKPKERHQAQPPSRTASHRSPIRGEGAGWRCDSPDRDHDP